MVSEAQLREWERVIAEDKASNGTTDHYWSSATIDLLVTEIRSLAARLAKTEASRDALRSAIDAAWAIAQAALAPGETNHAE